MPAPLAEQLGARLTSLHGLAKGTHVLTVPVDPEHLGPVRIVAHIGPESVRVELLGANDASREALRSSLADLRRDLTAAGVQVDVGSRGSGQPGAQGADGRPGDGAAASTRRGGGAASGDDPGGPRPEPDAPRASPGRIDLLV